MEIKNDKFIEYCKGKLFIPVWKNSQGEEVRDRWMTFEEDAVTSFNYLKALFDSEDITNCADFTYYIKAFPYKVCFVTDEHISENEMSLLIEGREEVECSGGMRLVDKVICHIKKQIGELNGN